MTTARNRLVDPAVTRWYHCVSRCVRRAFLLGNGGLSDRKAWLQNRLEELSQIFAIAVAGFAILDNHLHVLVRLDPDVAKGWTDEEVARRWARLYPPRNRRRKIIPVSQEWIDSKVANKEWIAKTRDRLASLSWFMKLLKEPLARMANKEDDCDGAFFAARFKSIAILDLQALLAVCAYIDLNPLVAGITDLFLQSPHTSIKERVEYCWPKLTREQFQDVVRELISQNVSLDDAEQTHWLCPLNDRRTSGAAREGMVEGLSLPKYLLLLDETSRLSRDGNVVVDSAVTSLLERLGTTVEIWQHCVAQLKTKFACRKLIGRVLATSVEILKNAALRFGLHHLVNLVGLDLILKPRRLASDS